MAHKLDQNACKGIFCAIARKVHLLSPSIRLRVGCHHSDGRVPHTEGGGHYLGDEGLDANKERSSSTSASDEICQTGERQQ